MTLHVHYESVSRDCDGAYKGRGVLLRNGEPMSIWDSIGWSVSPTYDTKVEPYRMEGGEHLVFNISFDTEEGHVFYCLYECDDDCDFGHSEHRDLSAERAGY